MATSTVTKGPKSSDISSPVSTTFSLLGTGNSTGVPWLQCVIDKSRRCAVCEDCLTNPSSKNRRNNPSALVSFDHPDGRRRNILIDVGKTFRDTVLKNFERLGVEQVDAVILTHGHMDAFGGLDDLRDISPTRTLPVYLTQSCFDVVSRSFSYLVKKPETKGLFIASLDWKIIAPFQPFEVEGLVIVPLPVEHGPPGPMLGFEFCTVAAPGAGASPSYEGRASDAADSGAAASSKTVPAADGAQHHHSGSCCGGAAENGGVGHAGEHDGPTTVGSEGAHEALSSTAPLPLERVHGGPQRIVYISDIAAMPADTRAYLKDGRPIDLLVLDALSYASYPTHFGFKQAVACALDVGAEGRTVFVGCNHRVDYYAESPKLATFGAAHGRRLELGYDGWTQAFQLSREGTVESVAAEVQAARANAARIPPPAGVQPVPHIELTGTPRGAAPGRQLQEDERPSTLPPASESATDAATHAPIAFTYADAVFPEWEDGMSPSGGGGGRRGSPEKVRRT